MFRELKTLRKAHAIVTRIGILGVLAVAFGTTGALLLAGQSGQIVDIGRQPVSAAADLSGEEGDLGGSKYSQPILAKIDVLGVDVL